MSGTRGWRNLCLPVLSLFALLGHGAARAQVAPKHESSLTSIARVSEKLAAPEALEPLPAVESTIGTKARDGWAAFRLGSEGEWQALVDRRTGLVAVAEGGGIAWVPGRGNALTAADVPALKAKETADLAALEKIARSFLPRVAPLLGVDPASLQLNRGRSGQPAGHVWFVDFDVRRGDQLVEGARVVFRVNNGNLIQFGTENLPSPGKKAPAVKISRRQALAIAEAEIGGFEAQDRFLDAGSLHLLPVAPADLRLADGFEPGQGRGLAEIWQLIFHREGVQGTWRARIDATTGELLELADINDYAHATGGIYPISPAVTPETVRPLPFVDLSIGGFTNEAGVYYPCCGTSTSHLAGEYVRIADSCGPISLAADAWGNLAFGTGGGTDCTTPGVGGTGNTHSSRTQYYHVNVAKEVGRGWLPANTWLGQQLAVNVNLNQTCNAYWNGTSLNFFKSGGGCSNTGENAAVSLHEYGHGLDQNDGTGTAPDGATGEAYGDWTAALALHTSCIGPGFRATNCTGYGDACTSCTGVRDIDWARHASNTPATVASFTQVHCPATGGGPCGREVHCESYVPSEAMWDFVNRDLPTPGTGAAWTVADRLWYLSRGTATGAFTCNTTGGTFTSNGCGAGSWWKTMRAVDDDDGNLANGTPHSCNLFAAFNRHGIACPTDVGANVCARGCTPPAAPALTVTAGNDQVNVQATGTGVIDLYRNESGCNAGFVKIANDSNGSLLDNGVANGTTYYYQAIAHPSGNEACASAPSTCRAVALCTTPSVFLTCNGNFRGSSQVSCFASATGGHPPYTYTWSYGGTANSWSSNGANAFANYNSPGCGVNGSAFNSFVVNVRDTSCPQPGVASISPLSCN
jgi:hypothetical protein